MGRPQTPLNWEELDKLCALQCTLEEIAGWFNCSVDTIERRIKSEKNTTFADYYELKRAPGKIALRRRQYQTAMGDPAARIQPNATMQIWLGKQWLGQKDEVDVNHGGVIQIVSGLPRPPLSKTKVTEEGALKEGAEQST
jgi:hypothetical protein